MLDSLCNVIANRAAIGMRNAQHFVVARRRLVRSCAAVVVLLCIAGTLCAAAPQVNKGDTIAQVTEKIGPPQGILKQGNYVTYYYERGFVDFLDGRVRRTDLVSPEEAERIKLERARAEEEARRQAEATRQRLTQEGQLELSKRLADKEFIVRPASERLAYWQEFSKRYPYTDVSSLTAGAEADVAVAQQRRSRTEELAALAARVAAIQKRFGELDTEYAASLANWKRNEISTERTNLTRELEADLNRVRELEGGQPSTNATPAAATTSG